MSEVLVVGAGPTGLTLACELWRHGTPCRIIERRGAPVDRSRAVDVQSRTLEVFARIGIVDQVLDSGRRLQAMSVYDGMKHMSRLHYEADGAPYPFLVALPQSDTERFLEQRLEALGGHVERGTRLKSLNVEAEYTNVELVGADGSTEQVQVGWVAGCDGVASTVRDEVGIEFEGKSAMRSFTTADATVDWHLPGDEVSLFVSDTGFLMALPLRENNRVRLISDGAPIKGRFGDAESLERMAAEHAGADLALHDAGFVGTYFVQRRLARTFQHNRVLLVGDAAHTFDPVGGHGMNQGIQSAFNLGWKLSSVANNRCNEALIATYASERRDAAKRFSRDMDFAARLKLSQLDVDEDTHDRLMDFAVRATPLRRSVLDSSIQPRHVYSSSLFVREDVASGFDSRPGATAGCRAPDVQFGDGEDQRLHRLLDGKRHTLLLFAGANANNGLPLTRSLITIAETLHNRWTRSLTTYLIAARGTDTRAWNGNVVADSNGSLHDRYGANLPCAYVVRPDDHIAYRSCPIDTSGLKSFVTRLFG